jgi:hypothetical protein
MLALCGQINCLEQGAGPKPRALPLTMSPVIALICASESSILLPPTIFQSVDFLRCVCPLTNTARLPRNVWIVLVTLANQKMSTPGS